jgi:hypothetical protein
MLGALACNLGSVPSGQASSNAVAAVALRLDGSRSGLSSFLGPASNTWALQPGTYLVAAVDQSGTTIVFPAMQIVAVPLIWPADFSTAAGTKNPGRAAAIKTLVRFLMAAESAKLTALSYSSAGFTEPLFAASPGPAALDGLYARYSALVAQQPSVLAALEVIIQLAPRTGVLRSKLAAPRRDWHDNLLGFFGYAGGAGARARDRILAIAETLTPDEQAEAFDGLREGFKGGATNFDDLAVKLQNGELDTQAAQMESDMRNAAGFAAGAQQAGATVGQVVHQEGGELVTKGAELDAEIIKVALGDAFPDISQGFDLADKAKEWTDYVESVYKNPLAVAEGEARGAIQEKIKERIREQLGKCCESLADDVADSIADSLSEQAMDAVPLLVVNIQATQTALAAELPPGQPGPASDGHARIDLLDTFSENLTFPDVRQVDFATNMALTADKDAAAITGELDGTGTYVIDVKCNDLFNASVIYETGTASYKLTYSAPVSGVFDPVSGQFSAPFNPAGSVAFVRMTRPFTDSHCTEMNTDLNATLPFTGAGTIRGLISQDGHAELSTDWTLLEQGSVHGTWSGQGQVTP